MGRGTGPNLLPGVPWRRKTGYPSGFPNSSTASRPPSGAHTTVVNLGLRLPGMGGPIFTGQAAPDSVSHGSLITNRRATGSEGISHSARPAGCLAALSAGRFGRARIAGMRVVGYRESLPVSDPGCLVDAEVP